MAAATILNFEKVLNMLNRCAEIDQIWQKRKYR